MSSIDEKTKNSLFWQTIIQPVWEIIRFVLSIYIARILNPVDYGIMGIASIIIYYSNYLSELGFSNALIHRSDISENHINTVFTINLWMSVLLTLIVNLCSGLIAQVFKIPELTHVLRILSLVFIFTAFSQIAVTLLRRELEYKRYTLIMLAKGLIQIVSTLVLALLHFEYWALILGTVASEFFGAVILFYSISIKPRLQFNKEAFKNLFTYGIWNFVIAQFFLLYSYAEKAIIGFFLGPKLVGIYEKAFSIAYMPVDSISMKINSVMFSSFNQYKNNKSELCNAFYNVSVFTSMLCFPILGGLFIVSHDFVEIAFGEKWLPMVSVLKILLVAFIFRVPLGLMSSLIMAAGDYKVYIKAQIFIYVIAILLYFPAVNYGIELIGLIIAVTNIVLFITSVYLSKKFIPEMSVVKYLVSLAPASINTGLMVLSVYLVKKVGADWNASLITHFLVNVFIGVLIYFILLFAIRFNTTKMIREKIRSIICTGCSGGSN